MLAAQDRRAAVFADRFDAGRQLAERLRLYAGRDDVVVLALPRGGLPVAHEVARAFEAPLDVYVVRKCGVPEHEELAMGPLRLEAFEYGTTTSSVVQAVREQHPARAIVAVRVGAEETCDEMATMADVVVCVRTPEPFTAVGYWYQDFSETTDADVRALLDERGRGHAFDDRNRVRRDPR